MLCQCQRLQPWTHLLVQFSIYGVAPVDNYVYVVLEQLARLLVSEKGIRALGTCPLDILQSRKECDLGKTQEYRCAGNPALAAADTCPSFA